MGSAYVYVLLCNDGTWYTGWTTNIEKRLSAHNGEIPGGAKYTKARRPVELIWLASCDTKITAQKLEFAIKARRREEKETLLFGSEDRFQSFVKSYISEGSCAIIKR